MATTTPNYGWPVPTDTDYVKDGAAAIEALGDAIDATVFALPTASGLTLINTQTIGTAVSSVEVTGAFSATYNNYRIIISGGGGSGDAYLGVRMGAASASYYRATSSTSYAGAPTYNGNSNTSHFNKVGFSNTSLSYLDCDLQNPFTAKNTTLSSRYIDLTAASGGDSGYVGGFLNDTSSYTAFTILPNAGTLTGGTIYVYGYQNS